MLFPWYTKYPYQNDEVLNLDWVLKTIDNLIKEVSDFVTLNTIKYADPIQWNITTQYEKNTVVIDPISGSAYISTKPVPAGVGLNNEDYWNIIFTLDVISANKNITLRDDANNILATFESEVDDWLLWQGTLYIVTRSIEIGQSYVVGYNIDRYTVERFLKEYISNLRTYVDTIVGNLDDLTTVTKTSIVGSINELVVTISSILTRIGNLNDLTTLDKTNLVAAINEVLGYITSTAAKLGDLSALSTVDKSTLVAAINELNGNIGSLSSLATSDKSSLVAAINELKNTGLLSDNSRLLVVGQGGRFNSIGDAIYYAFNHIGVTAANPVTIFILAGKYTEQIDLDDVHGLNFVGSGVENTVIEYNGDYPNCVVRVTGDVTFENLTIKQLASTYAVHIDPSNTDKTGRVSFIGCNLIGGTNAIGYGSGYNTELYVRGCRLYGSVNTLYCHNSPYNKAGQKLTIIDNVFEANSANDVLLIDDAGYSNNQTTSQMIVVFEGNTYEGAALGRVQFRKNTNTPNVIVYHLPLNDTNIITTIGCRNNTPLGLNYDGGIYNVACSVVLPSSPNAAGYYTVSIPTNVLSNTIYGRTLVDVTLPSVGVVTSYFAIAGVSEHFITLTTSDANFAGKEVTVNITLELIG